MTRLRPLVDAASVVFAENLRSCSNAPPMAAMGWPVQGRADLGGSRVKRVSWTPRRRLDAQALRGATTLEQQTLPAVIVACLGTLALIQVILTW